MAAPVSAAERIATLDGLRGFALLGILTMNVQVFAMVGAAYETPTAYGDLTGVNYGVCRAHNRGRSASARRHTKASASGPGTRIAATGTGCSGRGSTSCAWNRR